MTGGMNTNPPGSIEEPRGLKWTGPVRGGPAEGTFLYLLVSSPPM